MEPFPPATDPALIRRVLARLRHCESELAASQTEQRAPVMRHRLTLQLIPDDAIDDLNAVKPDWMDPSLIRATEYQIQECFCCKPLIIN
jgi:hypothetical protein